MAMNLKIMIMEEKDDELSPIDLLELQDDEFSGRQPVDANEDGFFTDYWSNEN